MGEIVRLFPDEEAFMDEIRKMSRKCPGRKRNKVLLLGGCYADRFFQFQHARLEWFNDMLSEYNSTKYLKSDRGTFDKILEEGKFRLERLQVVKAEGDVFSVVNKKEA